MRALRALGIEVIGEVELAWRLARCDFLAVTGTNGKTTTTSLLADMLARSDVASVAAGNIGLPLVEAVASIPSEGAIAVEVSSFQLDTIESFRPSVAVILNVAEDHTDWHGSFDAYARAKARIVMNQRRDDTCVVNLADTHAMAIGERAPSRVVPFSASDAPRGGIGVHDGAISWRGEALLPVDAVSLPGIAGLEDALAAAAAALSYGVAPEAVTDAIEGFTPLAHRLQLVGEIGGVAFIDDSKATNPHATLAAVGGFDDVVLIAGGRAKGIDLAPLRATAPPVRAVVAIGEAADAIADVFEGIVPVVRASSMDEAVRHACELAAPRGSVLLSPACASLDMYESYAARGADFARAVGRLAHETGRSHSHS
jgi:UDP-N-acetylmuramoylalanine--D-glutamate ligase